MLSRTSRNQVEVTNGDRLAAGRHAAAPGGLGDRLAAAARAAWRAVRPRRSAHRADPADRWAEVILTRLGAGHDVVLVLGAVTP